MAASYLMDSNILIDYASGKFSGAAEQKLDNIFNDSFHYSIISRMEVLGFNASPEVLKGIEAFLSTGTIFYVTDEISDQAILIRRLLPKIKLPDTIIAATAIAHSKTLLTRNTDDFRSIQDLQFDNPWDW